jgi:hypothetical protein
MQHLRELHIHIVMYISARGGGSRWAIAYQLSICTWKAHRAQQFIYILLICIIGSHASLNGQSLSGGQLIMY